MLRTCSKVCFKAFICGYARTWIEDSSNWPPVPPPHNNDPRRLHSRVTKIRRRQNVQKVVRLNESSEG